MPLSSLLLRLAVLSAAGAEASILLHAWWYIEDPLGFYFLIFEVCLINAVALGITGLALKDKGR